MFDLNQFMSYIRRATYHAFFLEQHSMI